MMKSIVKFGLFIFILLGLSSCNDQKENEGSQVSEDSSYENVGSENSNGENSNGENSNGENSNGESSNSENSNNESEQDHSSSNSSMDHSSMNEDTTPTQPVSISWTNPFILGSEAVDQALGLDLLPNSDLVIAGRTEGMLMNTSNAGFADGFVAFIHSHGELAWVKQFATPDMEQFLDVIYHPQDMIFAGGFSTGDFAGQSNQRFMDGILVALNLDGTVMWEKLLDLGIVNRLLATPTGVLVVGSYEQDTGDTAAFAAEYDLNGERIWLQTFNSPDFDSATSVTYVNETIYITGFTFGSINEQSSQSHMNIFVAAVNSEGETLWIKEYGGPGDDSAVRIDHDGQNLIIAGYTSDLLGEQHYGSNDIAVLKLDLNGTVIWQRQFGTEGSEAAYGLAIGSEGQILLSGRIDEASWDDRMNEYGDAFLLQLSPTGEMVHVQQYGSDGRDEFVDVLFDHNDICVAGYIDMGRDGGGENLDILVDRFTSIDSSKRDP